MIRETAALTTRKLDHLPVVAQTMRHLGLARIVDERVPIDPRSIVTTGQCLEALVVSILDGSHTLYRIHETLGEYDLRLALGWEMSPASFTDDRLGKALDAVFEAGLTTVSSAVLLEAVKLFALELATLHLDTTSLKVFGEYATSREPRNPEDPSAIPHLTRGYSKDHRPDLKQVVYGLTVASDGGVPLLGRAASGNRGDARELRYTMQRLAAILPDPRASTLVGDSKFFAGETLLLTRGYGFDFVTLLPRSVGLWDEAYASFQAAKATGRAIPVLKEEASDRDGGVNLWWGLSFDAVYRWEDAEKRAHSIPVRVLVVESSSLRQQKQKVLVRQRAKEHLALERAIRRLRKRRFACAADALEAANRLAAKRAPRFHRLEPMTGMYNERVKRARRGRPRKDEPRPTKEVWRVWFEVEEDADAFERILAEESCFILATSHGTHGPSARSDAQVFESYQEQFTVERAMHWAKGLKHVAPVFLKTPRRVAALGLVYVLALMVYALIQRQVRGRLAAATALIPDNGDGRWTSTPTTEVVFRLFEGVSTTRATGSSTVTVSGLTTEQVRVLDLLGIDVLRRPFVRVSPPRVPGRGDRGYRSRRTRRRRPSLTSAT